MASIPPIIWDARYPFPPPTSLRRPEDAHDVIVHHADESFGFLHDNAVVWHHGELLAGWYNCPEREIEQSACIRGRRSRDGGKTWSAVEVIAADNEQRGLFYVPLAFFPHEQVLYAFIATMIGHDLITGSSLFVLDPRRENWTCLGQIAASFLPNAAPVRMANGNFIMAGRAAHMPGTLPRLPAVAISRGERFTEPWDVIHLSADEMPFHPESTVWVDGLRITALVRQPSGATVFESADGGRTWTGPQPANFPASDSKLYAGELSTRQRCLIWNLPDPNAAGDGRGHLVIAVSRAGEHKLSAVWTVQNGFSADLGVGPEWSYPSAYEHDGTLHVIYTSQKQHSVLTNIPISSLNCIH